MKPSEVLQKAHERLSVPGAWGKGPVLAEGCTCIALVTTQVSEEDACDLQADWYVCKVIGVGFNQVEEFAWNDAPERTLQEILATLLKARDLALADGQ